MECWPNVTGNSLKIAAEVLSKGAKYDWVDWEMKTTSTRTQDENLSAMVMVLYRTHLVESANRGMKIKYLK